MSVGGTCGPNISQRRFRRRQSLETDSAPLPEGESAPTMAQLWAYAHRRYARFQGYAWGGVVIVGAVAWGASRVMGAGEVRKKAHAKTRA